MKLYFSPGACSLSPHIVLREAGLPFSLVKVDLKKGLLEDGTDFKTINSKGYVPLLELDNGTRLSEGPAIVQYLADQVPASALAPAAGSFSRYQLQEWLNFISSELHKQFSPLFDASVNDEAKAKQRKKIGSRLDWIEKQLGDERQFVTGSSFTVADAYLFTVLSWSRLTHIDLGPWPRVKAFMDRIGARPKVQEALKEEGLLK
jgi:glutathione S-transferase